MKHIFNQHISIIFIIKKFTSKINSKQIIDVPSIIMQNVKFQNRNKVWFELKFGTFHIFLLIFMFHATYLHHYPSGLASPSWSYQNFIIKHDPCLICTFVGTLNTLTQWHCNIPRGTKSYSLGVVNSLKI
jgi:hypothetical protein